MIELQLSTNAMSKPIVVFDGHVIELNVTDETDIQGDITPGMLVRVKILLLPNGTWETLSITPLGAVTEIPDCVTVVATVVSVDGNEVQFMGWPMMTLGSDVKIEGGKSGEGDENESGEEQQGGGVTLSPNQVVIVVVCPSEEGQIVIVQIIININITPGEEVGTPVEGEKVLVCHKPDKNGGKTLSISSSAVPAHLGHGDTLGGAVDVDYCIAYKRRDEEDSSRRCSILASLSLYNVSIKYADDD